MTNENKFDGITPDTKQLQIATAGALNNWLFWQENFEFDGEFSDLPTIQTKKNFKKFGQDYSLLRNYRKEICRDKIRKIVTKLDPRTGFTSSYKHYATTINQLNYTHSQKNHISIISKLFCLWNPNKFVMYDSLAPKGLRCLLQDAEVPTKSYYTSKLGDDIHCEYYDRYKKDFFELSKNWVKPLCDMKRIAKPFVANSAGMVNTQFTNSFQHRILDSYLMLEGRK